MLLIIDKEFNIFGCYIHLRFEPKAFVQWRKRIEFNLNNKRYVEAKNLLDGAKNIWGEDPDLVRLETLHSFLSGED